MTEGYDLAYIFRREDFLREMNSAAHLSYEHNKESGFAVYTDETFSEPYVNRAVLGKEHSISTDLTIGEKDEPGEGTHIPMDNYRLVHVHFHPPNHNLIPSGKDIDENLSARSLNVNLRDASSIFKRNVYDNEDGEETIKGYEMDYPNPASMIGLVRNNPENIGLLAYQGTTEEPITFDKFCKFVEDYCGTESHPLSSLVMRATGFPISFRSTKKVVEFLNASDYLRTVNIKLRNGRISERDLEKLTDFQLVQTRFFPYRGRETDYYIYPGDDYDPF